MNAMNLLQRTARVGLALSMLAFAAPAHGQTTADVLFDEGKALMKAGTYDRACPKIQEAHRLSPTPGTVLRLGDCLERAGKLASSWGAFKEAEVMARNAKDADREREAQRRSGLLAPKLARLAIVVPPAARIPGFELKRNGAVVGEGQWGSALPVDVGAHTIEVTAPGRKAWSTVVQIERDGSTASVEIPVLTPEASDGPKIPVLTPDASAGPKAQGSAWGAQRIAGVAVGGAGVVGLVVGAVFGARAISKNSESKAECSPTDPTLCNAAGAALRGEVKTAGTISTVAVVVGGVFVAGGLVLVLTAPSTKASDSVRLTMGAGVGSADFGLGLGRRW